MVLYKERQIYRLALFHVNTPAQLINVLHVVVIRGDVASPLFYSRCSRVSYGDFCSGEVSGSSTTMETRLLYYVVVSEDRRTTVAGR